MRWLTAAVLFSISGSGSWAEDDIRRTLEYAPAPVDNPLKGLVPYAGDVRDRFPHSLEFDYLPLSDLVVGAGEYDWAPLEKLLDEVAGRGHQAVIRIYLEYPGKESAIPSFLVRGGLKVHKYPDANAGADPPATIETPDYGDPKLRRVLKEFVAVFGERYDGDPRLGFVTAGLLGAWGEWHNYPREDLFASRAVQNEVLDAYEAAFEMTPILLRYPVGEGDSGASPNAGRPFGYHDDSFAWATLETGRPDDDWFFLTALRKAGPRAVEKWKTRPIGGEIRPEAWGQVFDVDPGEERIQDFRKCVEATHASWLMDSGMFERKQRPARVRRAEEQVRRMGYEFHVRAVSIADAVAGKLMVEVEVENRGVAPFYHEWPVEFGVTGADGGVTKSFSGVGDLTGLLPGDAVRRWNAELEVREIAAGTYRLLVRVPNPLPNGHPVRFANATQDLDAPGWLTLGEFERR